MSQNTSSAVMAQRVEAHDSLDFFPTPPWATRALCEYLNVITGEGLGVEVCWEPACGAGDMARPLREYFFRVDASDVAPQGYGAQRDFLFPMVEAKAPQTHEFTHADWIITNPPFRLAAQFVQRAIPLAKHGVAMLVRTNFLESVGRYEKLFSKNRPAHVLQFTERVPIYKGKLTANGTTATAYCWVIWRYPHNAVATELQWIAPCRRKLEREGDYDSR